MIVSVSKIFCWFILINVSLNYVESAPMEQNTVKMSFGLNVRC